ncbi:MAG TPA: histidine kinase, partial [Chitinophagaceae bacterium]|nr:histidine kinase [Chitinophagaceae bacterium]
KQKEKERIEKEKLITDLQLMKAQIRPGFLFNSLDQIYDAAQKNSPQAPELLLKLADLLSYLLYECEEPKVRLEKELTMMKEYMALEKARHGNRLELETVLKGDTGDKTIAPLLLLPFIENSFKHCGCQDEQPWINLDISIENEILSMKLINGVDPAKTKVSTQEIMNVEKRLQLLYPGKHELKKYVENEIYVVLLKINLCERPELNFSLSSNVKNRQNSKYAIQ